jgi:hypothetical protein
MPYTMAWLQAWLSTSQGSTSSVNQARVGSPSSTGFFTETPGTTRFSPHYADSVEHSGFNPNAVFSLSDKDDPRALDLNHTYAGSSSNGNPA